MATEKKIPFTKDGLRTIASLKEAVEYFQRDRIRSARIVNAYQEAHEVNLYNTSINMAGLKKNKVDEAVKKVVETIAKLKKGNQSKLQEDRIKKAVYNWYGVKTIQRAPTPPIEKEPIAPEEEITKA